MRTEESLAEVFVQLSDTLTAEFDVVEFLVRLVERCVELLAVDAAGLMLAGGDGALEVAAATSGSARMLELFQLQSDEGPCVDCHRSGQTVEVADVSTAAGRWPRFVPACRDAGFAAVHAVPLRCRDQTIGGMNLFRAEPGALGPAEARIARALTDVATIGLLQNRALTEKSVLVEQLQGALRSRVLIEQAKGALAERLGLDADAAFALLRQHARTNNRRLSDLATAVLQGRDDLAAR